tara:strand:- start:469 stop:681 length:213 start_codon:yes stop_codon:yes gene_type:complete
MNNSDMPAMPVSGDMRYDTTYSGLTKREHFAGLAMQGLLSHNGNKDADVCASFALEFAHALLKALETSHE